MTFTRILLYLLLLLMPLGNLTRLPFGSVAVTVNDFLLPLLIISWLILSLLGRKKIAVAPRSGWLGLFIVWAFFTLIAGLRYIGIGELAISGLYLLRWVEYATVFLIVYNEIKYSSDKVTDAVQIGYSSVTKWILSILIWGQIVFVLLGFIQFLLFPNFSSFVQHGWDPHYYRLLSTFLDPNFSGMFITLGIVLVVGILLFVRKLPVSRFVLYSYLAIAVAAIIITFSRSSYLAFAIAVGLLGVLKSRKLLIIFMLIGIMSFMFIPRVQTRIIGAVNIDDTAKARLDDYDEAFEIIEENPVIGVGFNTYRYAQDRAGFFRDSRGVNSSGGHSGAGVDSSMLFLIATTGFIGLAIYVSLHSLFLLDAWNSYRQTTLLPLVRGLGLAVFVSAASLFVHSQFVNSIFYPWIMLWIWTILGIMYGEKDRLKNDD